MSVRGWIAALVVASAAGWVSRGALSEEEKPAGPSPEEMEKQMTALATPGEQHKALEAFNGTWDVAGAFLEPGGKSIESKGTATFEMILGGRYSVQRMNGTLGGKPSEGFALMGFDNAKQVYVNYWFDTMSTNTAPAEGGCSADGKVYTLKGTWEVPGMSFPFTYVITWKSATVFTFEMRMVLEGKEMSMGQLTYTKK